MYLGEQDAIVFYRNWLRLLEFTRSYGDFQSH